jgi:hypothetical protein
VIGPGWLPRYRPRGLVTLGRRRRAFRIGSRAQKRSRPAQDTGTALYAVELRHAGSEFPLATARPREARAQFVALAGALQRWLVARWQWLRPRSVPCAVACLGMIAVLAFSDYLAHYNDGKQIKRAAVGHIEVAPR